MSEGKVCLQGKQVTKHRASQHQKALPQQPVNLPTPVSSVEQLWLESKSALSSAALSIESGPAVQSPQPSRPAADSQIAQQCASASQQSAAAAVAEATAHRARICQMEARLAASDKDKAELSAQLSAAQSCVQELEAAALSAEHGLHESHASHAEQQRQMADKLTQVPSCLLYICTQQRFAHKQVGPSSPCFSHMHT